MIEENELRAALANMSQQSPLGLEPGRLEQAIGRGRRARVRRRTAQSAGACAIAGVVAFAGVHFTGGREARQPINNAASCGTLPQSELAYGASVRVQAGTLLKGTVTSRFAATSPTTLDVVLPVLNAYVLDSRGRVVAHPDPAEVAPQTTTRTVSITPGHPRSIEAAVSGLVRCNGRAISTLPAGKYRLVVAFAVTVTRPAPDPGIWPRALVAPPAPFTIP